jgi:uncharacterized protein YbaR (Trm112 family)
VFIELTDHLRCPAGHDESFLVLLPDRIERRSVLVGQLGCPVCGLTFRLADGVLEFGAPSAPEPSAAPLDAPGLTALVGLHGPGGYLALVGAPAGLWRELAEVTPGVSMVAVNPPAGVADEPGVSVIRGDMLPLRSASMRGVVLGQGFGGDPRWVTEAARVLLPGLRVVGEGEEPAVAGLDVVASAGGWWVATKTRNAH